jgi:hypothetical protein
VKCWKWQRELQSVKLSHSGQLLSKLEAETPSAVPFATEAKPHSQGLCEFRLKKRVP